MWHRPSFPKIQYTKPEVFIIETLRQDDEQSRRYEGSQLAEMLRLSGKNPKYHYFQEERELPHLVALFRESQYRFLHFSCHGSPTEIFTTNGSISYLRFAQIFSKHLILRRLVVSACELGNNLFAEVLAGHNKGMHSILAPVQKIRFDHAAAIWNAFYVSLFTENDGAMTHNQIVARLKALRQLFPVDFHFAGYDSVKDKWKHQIITLPVTPVPTLRPSSTTAPPTSSEPPLSPS
jgi:hypothetical protein